MDLYRGMTKTTGKWIIGSVFCVENRAFALATPYLEAKRPAYNGIAMGCGVEDRGLTKNGYQAAEYGWEEALERYEENFPVWLELLPETVTRCCEKRDVLGNVLFESDIIKRHDGGLYEICYGKYDIFQNDKKEAEENVGFFIIRRDSDEFQRPMAIGATEKNAYLIGNIYEIKEEGNDE